PITAEGGAPFESNLEVIIELCIGSREQEIETDAELEAKLDIFEEQVLWSMFAQEYGPARCFRKMYKRSGEVTSMRLASNNHQRRLAMRDIVIPFEFDQRCKSVEAVYPTFNTLSMCFTTNGEQVSQSTDDTCNSIA
ncbi:MAG: hypothetical protein AAF709_02760, partial [Pseudomonadota bacterium]